MLQGDAETEPDDPQGGFLAVARQSKGQTHICWLPLLMLDATELIFVIIELYVAEIAPGKPDL